MDSAGRPQIGRFFFCDDRMKTSFISRVTIKRDWIVLFVDRLSWRREIVFFENYYITWQSQGSRQGDYSDRSPWWLRYVGPHCARESCRQNHLECHSWKRNLAKEEKQTSRMCPDYSEENKFMVIVIYGYNRFLLGRGSLLRVAWQIANRQR